MVILPESDRHLREAVSPPSGMRASEFCRGQLTASEAALEPARRDEGERDGAERNLEREVATVSCQFQL